MSYFPFHYKLLRFIGLGYFHSPAERNFNNFPNLWYTLYCYLQFTIWVVLITVTLWLEVPNIYQDLDKLMLNLTFSITFTTTFVKIYIIVFRNRIIQKIVYLIDQDLIAVMQIERISKETINRSRKFTLSVLGFANLTVAGLVAGGAVQAYFSPIIFYNKNGNQTEFIPADRILPVPIYLPFDINSDFTYSIAFIYQILGIQVYGNLVVIINTFANAILIHFAGGFENLRFLIENIRCITLMRMHKLLDTKKYVLSDEDLHQIELFSQAQCRNDSKTKESDVFSESDINREMSLLLEKCIECHVKLIKCIDRFQRAYSMGYLVHVLNNLGIVCHIMIQISENDIVSIRFGTAMALFFTVVSEMLVQCYTGNEMTLQALKIAQTAYNSEWYISDKSFKKSLIILMMRAQKPVVVTAGGFADISNDTFVSIMKGAYSLHAVIRTIGSK